jgi:hypothetical protein
MFFTLELKKLEVHSDWGCKKKIGKSESELEIRKPGNWGPGSDSSLKKLKTKYPGSSTRFLVLSFY